MVLATQRQANCRKLRLRWLLWLVLVLPVAQFTANWHLYAHGAAEAAGQSGNKPLLQHAHCDLCLTAAGMVGGAAPASDSFARFAVASSEAPQGELAAAYFAPAAPVYQSRAPPSLL